MSNSIGQPRPRSVKHKHRYTRKHNRVISFVSFTAIINALTLICLAMVLPDNVSITPRVGLLLIAGGMFTLAIGLYLYTRDTE